MKTATMNVFWLKIEKLYSIYLVAAEEICYSDIIWNCLMHILYINICSTWNCLHFLCMRMYSNLFLGHFAFLTLDKDKDDVFRKLLYFEVKFQYCFQQSLTKLSNSYFAKLHVTLKFLWQVKCLQYKQFS